MTDKEARQVQTGGEVVATFGNIYLKRMEV